MPEIPGTKVQATCKKCGGDQEHTVLEVVEGGKRIGKVRCEKCSDEHPYRRAKAAKVAKPKAAKSGSKPRSRSSSKKHHLPGELPVPEAWAQVAAMVEAAEKLPYEMGQTFDKGQVLQHATFGVGVVTGVLAPGKMEVLFPDARRKLVCGR